MIKRKDEVCAYYLGFGLCAKGLNAADKGSCSCCRYYMASGESDSVRNATDGGREYQCWNLAVQGTEPQRAGL